LALSTLALLSSLESPSLFSIHLPVGTVFAVEVEIANYEKKISRKQNTSIANSQGSD
jgi:hypothetical protein